MTEPHLTESPPIPETLADLFGAHLSAVCRRTAAALEACGFQGLLVHSGSLRPIFQDDRAHPFEVNAPFKVWTPLSDVPDCFVHFVPERPPRLLFHQPTDYWYKPAPRPQAYWTDRFEILPCADLQAARAALPEDLSHTAYLGEDFGGLAGWAALALNPPRLIRHLDYHRAVKSPYELACLRAANRMGARGHLAAARAFAAGGSEFDIELAFLAACGQREQELPYNPIIALNENGAVLHYQMLERGVPPARRSLLIDAGAEFGGYASDITRTHAAAAGDFAELIQRMDTVQQSLCARVKAGVDWREIHLLAHQLAAELLREADLVSCGTEEAIASGVTRVFLPHGIGHLLGLEVHDAGGFMRSPDGGDIEQPEGHPYLRLTRTLEPGFVVTLEPGLYFIAPLLTAAHGDSRARLIRWSRVDALRPWGGIRIEDDLAVTATGCENLTRDAFALEGAER
jgi:Xaa-Pro dipeptidase